MKADSQPVIVSDTWVEGKRYRVMKFTASPPGPHGLHYFEATYEEIKERSWRLVPGSLHDLGPVGNA